MLHRLDAFLQGNRASRAAELLDEVVLATVSAVM